MGVNSLPKTVTRQRRGCDLNPGPTAPESSTLTTQIPSHLNHMYWLYITSCCSTYSERPHRFFPLSNNFGSCRIFSRHHNGPEHKTGPSLGEPDPHLQGGPRKRDHRLMTIILSILNRFKIFFSLEDSSVNLQLNGYQKSHYTWHMLLHYLVKH